MFTYNIMYFVCEGNMYSGKYHVPYKATITLPRERWKYTYGEQWTILKAQVKHLADAIDSVWSASWGLPTQTTC